MPELRGESDISIFALLVPSLYGHLMLVVCLHQKNLSVCTLCTCLHMSVSDCGHPLSLWGFLVAQMVKNMPAMQQTQFNPWVRKIPWRTKGQPTPGFLPAEFHAQRSLVGSQRAGHD